MRAQLSAFDATSDEMNIGKRTVRYGAVLLGCLAFLCICTLLSLPLSLFHCWDSTSESSESNIPTLPATTQRSSGSIIPLPSHFAAHYKLNPSQLSDSPAYSSHRCIGPDLLYSRRSEDHLGRRCLLHNVCVNRDINGGGKVAVNGSDNEVSIIIDYLRPEQEVSLGWVDPLSPFDARVTPRPLVALRHGGRSERSQKLHSLVVNARPSWSSRSRRFLPGTHVLHQLLASGDMNFGHFLLDDAYAMWETVRSFDPNPAIRSSHSVQLSGSANEPQYYAPDSVQLLTVSGCSDFSAPLARMCNKFASALFPAVSTRPAMSLQSAYSHYQLSEETDELCFETLIAGTGSAGAVGWGPNNRNRAASFSVFRNEMYLAHGLDPFYRPPHHHLVLVDKRGRRGFSNLRATYEQLKLTPRYADLQITVVDDFKQWSFVEQLRLLSSATIVLSPCGGISMLFLLLPFPSTLIVSTFPERVDNNTVRSVRMEGHVWDWQANVHTVHYPLLDNSDFVLPAGVNPSSRYALRNHASTVLKMGRLRHIIDQAILRAASLF